MLAAPILVAPTTAARSQASPDLLTFSDGRKVESADARPARRAGLAEQLQDESVGRRHLDR